MKRYQEKRTKSPLTGKTSEGILIHENADDMPNLSIGRLTRLPGDNSIFSFVCEFPAKDESFEGRIPAKKESGRIVASSDNGESWQPQAPFCSDGSLFATRNGAFIGTANGVLIAAFTNLAEMKKPDGAWDPELKEPWILPTCTVRSLDGGKTWQDIQKLHDEWTGANRSMIQTQDGTIVFTSMKLLGNPGRHAVLTYRSTDDGETWEASNIIDLGGCGHHGGLSEATLVELKDGRLLKYIRTNWGQFWRAYSTDGGRYWHPFGPAGIDASSAPGDLWRLASGRIALAWNRLLPEGKDSYPLSGGDCQRSATPVSNFRNELSISFSEDEGESWLPPVVIARNPEGTISYPYIFEFEPGILWITAHRWNLKMRLLEKDFTS